MVVDSSALVAIIFDEPEGITFIDLIRRATRSCVAAPTLLETSLVLVGRRQDTILDHLDSLVRSLGITVLPFTADHAAVAREAFLAYGKGRHPAALNFGDCIAYATARLEAMPLLFKGDDFRLTDIDAAA